MFNMIDTKYSFMRKNNTEQWIYVKENDAEIFYKQSENGDMHFYLPPESTLCYI